MSRYGNSKGGRGSTSKSRPSSGSALSSAGSKGSTPKGQIKGGKTVQYSIKDSSGNTKYVGTTNNPSRRAAEHRQTGKMASGDKMAVETKAIPRQSSERVESAKIGAHRRTNGQNPQHNKTNDGRYHPSGQS